MVTFGDEIMEMSEEDIETNAKALARKQVYEQQVASER